MDFNPLQLPQILEGGVVKYFELWKGHGVCYAFEDVDFKRLLPFGHLTPFGQFSMNCCPFGILYSPSCILMHK